MKKLTTKLLISVLAVVLALTTLGTSTFAWFTMNTTATATGMTINAKSDSSLVIKGTKDSNFSSIGTNELSETSLKPCTSANGINFAKLGDAVNVTNPGSSAATWSGTNNAFQASDLTTLSDTSGYVAESSFTIKNVGSDTGVGVQSITIGGNNAMNTSLRVAITLGSQTFVYNPQSGTLTDGKVGSLNESTWTLVAPSYKTVDSADSLATLSAGTEYTVKISIWFEGQDTGCYSDHVSTTDMTVEVVFKQISVQ